MWLYLHSQIFHVQQGVSNSKLALIGTQLLSHNALHQERIRTNVRGRREEEHVTLIGASTLGRLFERFYKENIRPCARAKTAWSACCAALVLTATCEMHADIAISIPQTQRRPPAQFYVRVPQREATSAKQAAIDALVAHLDALNHGEVLKLVKDDIGNGYHLNFFQDRRTAWSAVVLECLSHLYHQSC